MAENWTAEITNDPDRNYDLYIELLEGTEYRGRICRAREGTLYLKVYGCTSEIEIPLEWLMEVAEGARKDLPPS